MVLNSDSNLDSSQQIKVSGALANQINLGAHVGHIGPLWTLLVPLLDLLVDDRGC